jgi:hypothetical protein
LLPLRSITHILLSDHEHEANYSQYTQHDQGEQNPLQVKPLILSSMSFTLRRIGIHIQITLSIERVVAEALYLITARALNYTNTSQKHPASFFSIQVP